MGYYEVDTTDNKEAELGRKIYMEALSGRRGFRDDQLGIEDEDIWLEIFEAIGQTAREALMSEDSINLVDQDEPLSSYPSPETNLEGDCLPKGHVILEQADMPDGRVSQIVRVADGAEYERIVHADEAYGVEE